MLLGYHRKGTLRARPQSPRCGRKFVNDPVNGLNERGRKESPWHACAHARAHAHAHTHTHTHTTDAKSWGSALSTTDQTNINTAHAPEVHISGGYQHSQVPEVHRQMSNRQTYDGVLCTLRFTDITLCCIASKTFFFCLGNIYRLLERYHEKSCFPASNSPTVRRSFLWFSPLSLSYGKFMSWPSLLHDLLS